MYVLKYAVETTYRGNWKEYPYEEVIDVTDNIALCQAETSKMYLEFRGFKAIGVIDNATQLQQFLQDLNGAAQRRAEEEEKRPPISYKDMLQPIPAEFTAAPGSKVDTPQGPDATAPSDNPKWWKA